MIKQSRPRFFAIFIVATIMILLCAAGKVNSFAVDGVESKTTTDIIEVKSPLQNATVKIDRDQVKEFFKKDIGSAVKFYGKGEQLPSKPIKLEWTTKTGRYYEVYVADNPLFKNAEKYVCLDGNLELKELIPEAEYFWKVKVIDDEGNKKFSKIYNFNTGGNVRAFAIDGVSNVRDIGGKETSDGRKIEYEMIYRSGEGEKITEKGKTIIKKLGIKVDFDLRGASAAKNGSPFGETLKVLAFNGAYYAASGYETGIDGSKEYKNAFRDELKACADSGNYPMIIHCSLGRDRTGTLAFILEALCGVEKEALVRDHMLSFLSEKGSVGSGNQFEVILSNINALYNYIDRFEGETFAEKTATVVKKLGVTDREIDSIRKILLG